MKIQNITTNTSFKAALSLKTTEPIFTKEQLELLAQKAQKVGSSSDIIQAEIGSVLGSRFIKQLRAVKIKTFIDNKPNEFSYYSAEYSPAYIEIMNTLALRSGDSTPYKPSEFAPINEGLKELPFFEFLSNVLGELGNKFSKN